MSLIDDLMKTSTTSAPTNSEITKDEVTLVESQRKPEKDKPSFYNSQSRKDQKISADFEAYLILQAQSQKAQVLSWLRKEVKINDNATDRDKVLTEYLEYRKTDATKRIDEMDAEMEQFNKFKSEILGSRLSLLFSSVIEYGLMIKAMQKSMDEISVRRDLAFNDANTINSVTEKLNFNKSDEHTKKELESWQKVVSSYKGNPTDKVVSISNRAI